MSRHLSRIVLFLLLSLTATFTFAQSANTSLRGVIKDPTGALVPGAKINILDNATGQSYSAEASSSGEYQFTQIPPAKYTITVTATGFGAQTKTAELLVNQPATINFALSVTTTQEILNVTAEAQTLNTTDASLGNSADNATIQALPSETRNVPDLLSLQPGVLYLPPPANPQIQDSRSGAVNGGRSDQGNVTVDGIDDNDQVNGFAFTGVLRQTQDSIEEFRVTTGGANAEAGHSSGAQISMVTKSGTNRFHGAAYEYNRPTITVANDFFNKQAQLNSGQANRPPKIIRNIFGGDVGGPIFKDKFFFFANYEGTRRAESAQVTQTVPTADYQAGILKYQGAAGGNVTLTAAQVTTLDAGCTVCKTAAYTPGPGPNPNALAYFKSMPAANGFATGDGLNTGSFSFSSPNPVTLNTTIVRLDYLPSSKHRIFARGNLQKDTTGATEHFPGQGPSSEVIDNSKGMTFGDTWTISPSMVNDIRYGYIRQGIGNSGVGSGDYVDFRFIATATAETRNTITSVPVNNIVDNLNWTKGHHNIQVGGNWRLVHQNRASDANSFNSASSNPSWLGGRPIVPSPSTIGQDPVNGSFSNSYLEAYANLVGTVPSVTDNYNYAVSSATSGTLLADGQSISRTFKANEYEWYVQDSWRVKPNLTLTFGIRHTILQTPWETKGQQVAPTIDTHTWFQQRAAAAAAGQIYEPDFTFAPNGPFYNKPGFWPKSKNNFAPRIAIAYSPDNKTSIRAGAGMYYDHYGQSLINIFDQNGAFGLSTSTTNAAGKTSTETAPRFTDRHTLPFSNGTAPATQPFPFTPVDNPDTGFAITWGLDSKLKTPYSEAFDLSVQRELPGGFTLETAYVGRLGRHLLQSLDLAEPVDFVDPLGGGDYFTAGAKLSALVDQNGGNDASVPAIPYFENVFPFMKNIDRQGESATQAIYSNEWVPFRADLGATTALADIDFYCAYGCPAGYKSKFWQGQFSSLYALSTIGMSYYNAGQVTLRHPMSHGLQADISYTYSRSIDFGSDAERNTEFSGNLGSSSIINSFNPALNRAVSDFDTTHLLTVDWVYQMPFGKGALLASSANNFVNAFIGGWQLSGILRTTSGLPFSFNDPGWTTDWQQSSNAVVTGKATTHRHFDQNGNPQYFDNIDDIVNGVSTGGPIRLSYPGENGQRNKFRGDGIFALDSGLSKTWALGDYGKLKFAWEVYNVTNTNRFDGPAGTLTNGSLGVSSTLLSVNRRMQFALRYDF